MLWMARSVATWILPFCDSSGDAGGRGDYVDDLFLVVKVAEMMRSRSERENGGFATHEYPAVLAESGHQLSRALKVDRGASASRDDQ